MGRGSDPLIFNGFGDLKHILVHFSRHSHRPLVGSIIQFLYKTDIH